MSDLKERLYKEYLALKEIHSKLPKEWSWQWQRWCMENCNSLGQCGWVREKCPFMDFKLKLFRARKKEGPVIEKLSRARLLQDGESFKFIGDGVPDEV